MKYCYVLLCLLFLLSPSLEAQKKKKKKKQELHYTELMPSAEEILATEDRLNRVVALFTGQFSNKAQADTANSPRYTAQHLIGLPIWENRKGECWVYMRWTPWGQKEVRVAQGVFKFQRLNRDTITMQHFGVPDTWLADNPTAWEFPSNFDEFSPKELIELPANCLIDIFESPEQKGLYHAVQRSVCPLPLSEEIQGIRLKWDLSAGFIKSLLGMYNADAELLFEYQRPDGLHFEREEPETRDKKKRS